MITEKIDLNRAFSSFNEHWKPKLVAELNGQHVKVAKIQGEFEWHHHENEDELFLVHKGHLKLELRDRTIELDAGQFFVVPKGIEHRPVAEHEVELVLFEPAETLNTGNLQTDRTVANVDWIELG